jgi:hypothetical protein
VRAVRAGYRVSAGKKGVSSKGIDGDAHDTPLLSHRRLSQFHHDKEVPCWEIGK